jgi:hypothetical protein
MLTGFVWALKWSSLFLLHPCGTWETLLLIRVKNKSEGLHLIDGGLSFFGVRLETGVRLGHLLDALRGVEHVVEAIVGRLQHSEECPDGSAVERPRVHADRGALEK